MSKRTMNWAYLWILVVVFTSNLNPVFGQDGVRKFQIEIVPISTPLGSPVVTEETSREIVRRVNESFMDSTDGKIVVEFRKLLPMVKSETAVVAALPISDLIGGTPKSDEGYEKVIVIGVITRNPALNFAGMAGGNYMLLNGTWNLASVKTVVHELGHNFGLMHANSLVCGTVIPITCESREYGDASSVMGSSKTGLVTNPSVARFSVSELFTLNLISDSQTVLAVDSGDYRVFPAFGSDKTKPRIIFIPIAEQMVYSVEYRPPVGKDSLLANTTLSIPNEISYYFNQPSYGVQLRVLSFNKSKFPELLPTVAGAGWYGTGLIVDSFDAPQVNAMGKNFLLSDRSTLNIVSASPEEGALIRLNRPQDSLAPTLEDVRTFWSYKSAGYTINNIRQVKLNSEREWDYPAIEVSLNAVENRKLKSLELEINGEIKATQLSSSPSGTYSLFYQTRDVGKFEVRAIAKDYAGNVAITPVQSFQSEYFKLRPVDIDVEGGDDRRNSLRIYVSLDDRKYQLSNLSSGRVVREELKYGDVMFEITEIERNKEFSASLESFDELGHTDGGQIIRYKPRASTCTNTECFVGFDWQATTYTWPKGVGEMSLQELVNGKWIAVVRSKPVPVGNTNRVTYQISLSNLQEGKRTFRFNIASSKKYKSYVGKPFTLNIKP